MRPLRQFRLLPVWRILSIAPEFALTGGARAARRVGMLAVLGLSLASVAIADPEMDGLPKAPDKARYATLRSTSPFSLATAPAATPAPKASFAANWFVTGIGRIGSADFVSIKSRDLSHEFSLFKGDPAKSDEVALVSVDWSEKVGKSTVILRKGNEMAKLEFNEAEVRAKAASASPAAAGAGAAAGAKPAGYASVGSPAGSAAAAAAAVAAAKGNAPVQRGVMNNAQGVPRQAPPIQLPR